MLVDSSLLAAETMQGLPSNMQPPVKYAASRQICRLILVPRALLRAHLQVEPLYPTRKMVCDMEEDQDHHAYGAGNHYNFDPADGAVGNAYTLKKIGLTKDQMCIVA